MYGLDQPIGALDERIESARFGEETISRRGGEFGDANE